MENNLSTEERIELALSLKEKGNQMINSSQIQEAGKLYSEALFYLSPVSGLKNVQVKKQLFLNLALVDLKKKNFTSCIQNAETVLSIEPDCLKARYRKGCALMEIGEYQRAKDEFQIAQQLDPTSNIIAQSLQKLIEKEKESKIKEKKMWWGAFAEEAKEQEKELAQKQEINDNPKSNLDNLSDNFVANLQDHHNVFFDIQVEGKDAQRIEIQLFNKEAPKTCENFRRLCNEDNKVEGNILTYKNSCFHRLVKNFMIQGGKIESCQKSIYSKVFDDENLLIQHSERGMVAMANNGPNTNETQFYIIFRKTAWLDGKHVVFGKVTSGLDFLTILENIEVQDNDLPLKEIKIINCGEIKKQED